MKAIQFRVVFLALVIPLFAFTDSSKNFVPVIEFDELKQYWEKPNDTLYVINFWATWCKPCVGELPYFDSIQREFEDQKVSVLLVSLDFTSRLESKVKPFLKKHRLVSKVVLLDQPRGDAWINEVSRKWSGAIPATLLVRNRKAPLWEFYEQSFDFSELESLIEKNLEN